MSNGKRQASIAKELVGAWKTKLHNLKVKGEVEDSLTEQLRKAQSYANMKKYLKPAMDFIIGKKFPGVEKFIKKGGVTSEIAKRTGMSFGTDALYDTIFGKLFGMQADPSKITSKSATKPHLIKKVQKKFDKSISKSLSDRMLESAISGGVSWAMGGLGDSAKTPGGDSVGESVTSGKSINPKTGAIEYKPTTLETKSFKPRTASVSEKIVKEADPLLAGRSIPSASDISGGTRSVTEGTRFAKPDIQTAQMTTGTKPVSAVDDIPFEGPPEAPWFHDKSKDFYNIFGWKPETWMGAGGTLAALLAMGAGRRKKTSK